MQGKAPKILFLAAQVQPFLVAGIKALVKKYNATVLVICHPPSGDAPLRLPELDNVVFRGKLEGSIKDVETAVVEFGAEVAWGAGWMDRDYLRWLGILRRRGVTTIMGMDAQWKGTLRQWLNTMTAPFFIRSVYSHVWVPGIKQKEYALNLGFQDARILENLLTPDIFIFSDSFNNSLEKKKQQYPRSLIFIGRMDENKFENLLSAFSQMTEAQLNGWNLVVAGKGQLSDDNRMRSPAIKHIGYLQPEQLAVALQSCGAFCLVSRNEAWGTVIQEAAAAGLPLLVSKQCGAHYSMVKEGYNGFLCDGNSVESIKEGILKIVNSSAGQLLEMGQRSHEIGVSSTPELWADTLMSVYKD